MEREERLRAILLDFDGTIVDLPTDYDSMKDSLREFLGGRGINSTLHPLLDSLDQVRRDLAREGRVSADSKDTIFRAYSIIRDYEMAAANRAVARPGAADFLRTVKAAGLRVAIVTNNARETVEFVFKARGFPKPDAIVGLGDAPSFKPSPEPAQAALRALGVRSSQTIVIGDSDRDLGMGRSAGIPVMVIPKTARKFPSVGEIEEVARRNR